MVYPASGFQSVEVSWLPSTDPLVVGYNVHYGGASGQYTNVVPAGSSTNAAVAGLIEGATYFFAATDYYVTGSESAPSTEVAYTVPAVPSQPPTLASISNLTVSENSALQTVVLSAISAGSSNYLTPLTITAVSSNPGLIPTPAISYVSPNTSGTLTFTPVAAAFGTAVITVTVNNGQPTNNLVSRSFTVTVNWVNQHPTLDPIANLTLYPNAGLQQLLLSGITSGAANESQALALRVKSSNLSVVPLPTLSYVNPSATATLSFLPIPLALGTSTVTVTVTDGQAQNSTYSRSFTVSIIQPPTNSTTPINQAPTLDPLPSFTLAQNSGTQTVKLTGISAGATNAQQKLTISAVSSQPTLIPAPKVVYTSPATNGFLTFAPVANALGPVTISVTVNDGQPVNNKVTRSFMVTLVVTSAPPAMLQLASTKTALMVDSVEKPILVDAPPASRLGDFVSAEASGPTGSTGLMLSAPDTGRHRLGVPQRQPDGSWVFLSKAADGRWLSRSDLDAFQIWASSDLQNWQPIPVQVGVSNGSFVIHDRAAPGAGARFYRVVETR